MSSDFETLSPDEEYALVVALSEAHDCGNTSCVFCLKLRGSIDIHVTGDPFRLLDKEWRYIWKNDRLRDLRIDFGSIIVMDKLSKFVGNTGKKMGMDTFLSQLQFEGGSYGTAYRGIAEAFPKAEIAPTGRKGICQSGTRPNPPYALISILKAFTVDRRIVFKTRLGERVNLNNRSGVCQVNGIGKADLPVQKPKSKDDICDVILVGFGSQTFHGDYLAVCEGLYVISASQHWQQTKVGHLRQAALRPLVGNQLPDRHFSQVTVPSVDKSCSFSVIPTDLSKLPDHIHPDSKDVYPMKSKPRGIALIINNEVFPCRADQTEKENLDRRCGSEKDAKALKMLFKKLHFKVTVKRNLGREAILKVLDDVASEDHSAHDCFVLCIMSHGIEGLFFGSDGETLPYETVFDIFSNSTCRTLKGKPKLIFIQACRGHDRQTGVVNDAPLSPDPRSMAVSTAGAADEQWKFKFKEAIPDYSDVLVAYSTINGYVSYRDHHYGSRFVRCLVKVFKEKAGHEDILSMLTMVNDRLVKMGDIGSKQVAQPAFTLTKKLFFWPGL